MIVYRVEHVDTTQGPYNPGYDLKPEHRDRLYEAQREHGLMAGDVDRHPTPERDEIDVFFEGVHFSGFASLDDLFAWFGAGFVEAVVEAGFTVATYFAAPRDVQIGGHQIAFVRSHARRLTGCPTLRSLRKELTP